MAKQSRRSVHPTETNKPERGVFTLLDGDPTEEELRAAVRALYGLPDDYDFSDEAEEAWAAEHESPEATTNGEP